MVALKKPRFTIHHNFRQRRTVLSLAVVIKKLSEDSVSFVEYGQDDDLIVQAYIGDTLTDFDLRQGVLIVDSLGEHDPWQFGGLERDLIEASQRNGSLRTMLDADRAELESTKKDLARYKSIVRSFCVVLIFVSFIAAALVFVSSI